MTEELGGVALVSRKGTKSFFPVINNIVKLMKDKKSINVNPGAILISQHICEKICMKKIKKAGRNHYLQLEKIGLIFLDR